MKKQRRKNWLYSSAKEKFSKLDRYDQPRRTKRKTTNLLLLMHTDTIIP